MKMDEFFQKEENKIFTSARWVKMHLFHVIG